MNTKRANTPLLLLLPFPLRGVAGLDLAFPGLSVEYIFSTDSFADHVIAYDLSPRRPRGRLPSISMLSMRCAIYSGGRLAIWPNQRSLDSFIFSLMSVTIVFRLIVSLLILSKRIFPCDHLNKRISVTCTRCSSSFVGFHVSDPYMRDGRITVL